MHSCRLTPWSDGAETWTRADACYPSHVRSQFIPYGPLFTARGGLSGLRGLARGALVACAIAAAWGCSGGASRGGVGENTAMTIGAECDSIGEAYCRRMIPGCLATHADGKLVTVEDQCGEIAQALCRRNADCGDTTTEATCMQQALTVCCGNMGNCPDNVLSGESAIQVCTSAVALEACDMLQAGIAAPECTSVVRDAPPAGACQSQIHDACCDSADCTSTAREPQSAIDDCNSQIEALACSETSLPVACQGVVAPASFAAPIGLESYTGSVRRAAPLQAWMQSVYAPPAGALVRTRDTGVR